MIELTKQNATNKEKQNIIANNSLIEKGTFNMWDRTNEKRKIKL